MNVALKEWSAVIEALDRGLQIFLLRKGGIMEGRRGFELRYPEFLLFPTFEHQHARYLKPEFSELVTQPAGAVPITHLARVVQLVRAPQPLSGLETLARHHVWNEEFLGQRYSYRPDLPLYLVVVRVYRLRKPHVIPMRPSYAGCKSWVHLTEEISIDGAEAIIADREFDRRRAELAALIGSEDFEQGKQAAE
ncbi:MAG TPA: DUF1802 family protein [Bryobacteraceae bacterium]|nr:DUF1802 family protein [Bryobacteraceae bacterium]